MARKETKVYINDRKVGMPVRSKRISRKTVAAEDGVYVEPIEKKGINKKKNMENK
jgi:hypothetical protein